MSSMSSTSTSVSPPPQLVRSSSASEAFSASSILTTFTTTPTLDFVVSLAPSLSSSISTIDSSSVSRSLSFSLSSSSSETLLASISFDTTSSASLSDPPAATIKPKFIKPLSSDAFSTPSLSASSAPGAFQNDPLTSSNAVIVTKSDNAQQNIVNDPTGARPGSSSSYISFTTTDDKTTSLKLDTQPAVQSSNAYSVSVWVKSAITGSACSVNILIGGTTIGSSGTIPAEWTEVTGEYDANDASPTLSLAVTCLASTVGQRFRARADGSLGMSDLSMKAAARARKSSLRNSRAKSAPRTFTTFATASTKSMATVSPTLVSDSDVTKLPPLSSFPQSSPTPPQATGAWSSVKSSMSA
ncbi:hypothetical protein GQ44DRAFT_427688 [Phaeosphaeriaceae sp. PMI808]|nr:hypothetical protein GQ44DRAFT_427688 [Phaeosphaeriaceae sp. PMI808]